MEIRTLKNEVKTTDTTNEIKGKVIRKSQLARQILQRGGKDVWLFDLKPDRDNHDRTVFVFRDDDKFQEVFAQVLDENRKAREKHDAGVDSQKAQIDVLTQQVEELKKMLENKE